MDVHEFSVADARRRLADVLAAADGGAHVTITRRGKAVARVVSVQEYDLLVRGRPDVWVAIEGHRARHGDTLADDGWADDVRSTDPGRPAPFGE